MTTLESTIERQFVQIVRARGGMAVKLTHVTSYLRVHLEVTKLCGHPAKWFECITCGGQAREWAYQYSGGEHERVCPKRNRLFSVNLYDYAPMCGSCHQKFDMEKDPSIAEMRQRVGKESAVKRTAFLRANPEVARRGHEAGAKNFADFNAAVKSDPELRERIVSVRRNSGTKLSKIRVQCAECDVVSSHGGIGTHHKFSGHSGKVVLDD